jgi:hypothetical protein
MMVLVIFSVAGWKMTNKTWVNKMFSEMETADKIHSEGWKEDEKNMNQIVQKYFRPGMPKEEAFRLLNDLQKQGFDVGEYRHEGAKNWPDGELKPYWDDATKRNLQRQIPPSVSRIIAVNNEYGKDMLIFRKGVSVSFTLKDGEDGIRDVIGRIWSNSI